MIWNDINTWAELRAWLRSEAYAILCGSGISRRSGLPTGQNFNATFLSDVIEPDWRTMIANHLQPGSPVPLRFEGILDVWWRICEPQLPVLNTYRLGEPTSEHRALAHLARSHAVVTTNFDGLIERAWSGPAELKVAYTDEHFKAALCDSGLYKIHGTLQRFTKGNPENVTHDDEGFPIATLRAISGNMESLPRRSYLHRLREAHPFLVVGYSGMDDFDVCRWLFESGLPRESVWIDYDKTARDVRVLSGREAVAAGCAPRPILRAAEDRTLDAWKIVFAEDPARLLGELSGQPYEETECRTESLFWGSPSDWQKSVVTALLLLQLSRFRGAEALLRHVIGDTAMSPVEKLKTEMWLAQVLIPTGHPHKRQEALASASTVADSGLMEPLWKLRASFLATQAKFFTRSLSASDLDGKLTALHQQAISLGDAELAVDVLVGDFAAAATEYEDLFTLPESAKLGERMRGAADFNARLCRAWQDHGTLLAAELPASHKGVKFWEHRLGRLQELAKASALIDPLPPSN